MAHPQFYSAALFNDIALVILDKPVNKSVNVAPICIPQQGSIFPAGVRCLGVGWGKNSFGEITVITVFTGVTNVTMLVALVNL